MANKVVGTLGAATALTLALMWIINISVAWNWLWSENAIVMFNVNLWTVRIRRGTLGYGMSLMGHVFDQAFGTSASKSLRDIFDHDFWMGQAVQQLCMSGIDTVWQWCDTWVFVQHASMIQILLSWVTILLLAMGGAFQYYYANEHATHTGRMWIRVCFIAAPICSLLAMMQYTLLTFMMGRGERQFIETKAGYGPGFIISWCLSLFTLAPLYIHVIFSKVNEFEKHGDNDMLYGQGLELPNVQRGMVPGYPSNPPQMGFGGYPQQARAPAMIYPTAVYSTSQYAAGQAAYQGPTPANW
uniref:Uncharacterized protein n=1 Tax=Alexandrium monilatum TaxID=311494 RepID=A0A7S4SPP9_9DINO